MTEIWQKYIKMIKKMQIVRITNWVGWKFIGHPLLLNCAEDVSSI